MIKRLTILVAFGALGISASAAASAPARIGNLHVMPRAAVPGAGVTVFVTVRRSGVFTFLLSHDRTRSSGDARLGQVAITMRRGQRRVSVRWPVTIPLRAVPRGERLLACGGGHCTSTPMTVSTPPVPAISQVPPPTTSPALPPVTTPAPSLIPLDVPPLPGPPGPFQVPGGRHVCRAQITHFVATSPTTIVATTSVPFDADELASTVVTFSNGLVAQGLTADGDQLTITTARQTPGLYYQAQFGTRVTPSIDPTFGIYPGLVEVVGYTTGVPADYVYNRAADGCVLGTWVDDPPYESTPAYPTAIAAISPTSVLLTFSSPVDPGSVFGDGSQFVIWDDVIAGDQLLVSHATVNGATIRLTTAPQSPNQIYQVGFIVGPTAIDGTELDEGPTFFGGYGYLPAH